MGSTHAYLVGPWEPRLKAIVGNCCFPTYAGIHRAEILHCFPNFIPGLLKYGDVPEMAALIAHSRGKDVREWMRLLDAAARANEGSLRAALAAVQTFVRDRRADQ